MAESRPVASIILLFLLTALLAPGLCSRQIFGIAQAPINTTFLVGKSGSSFLLGKETIDKKGCSEVNFIKAAVAGADPALEAAHVLTSAVYDPARSVLFAAGSTSADSDANFASPTTNAVVMACNDDLSVRRATSVSVEEKLDDVAVAIALNTVGNLLVATQSSIPNTLNVRFSSRLLILDPSDLRKLASHDLGYGLVTSFAGPPVGDTGVGYGLQRSFMGVGPRVTDFVYEKETHSVVCVGTVVGAGLIWRYDFASSTVTGALELSNFMASGDVASIISNEPGVYFVTGSANAVVNVESNLDLDDDFMPEDRDRLRAFVTRIDTWSATSFLPIWTRQIHGVSSQTSRALTFGSDGSKTTILAAGVFDESFTFASWQPHVDFHLSARPGRKNVGGVFLWTLSATDGEILDLSVANGASSEKADTANAVFINAAGNVRIAGEDVLTLGEKPLCHSSVRSPSPLAPTWAKSSGLSETLPTAVDSALPKPADRVIAVDETRRASHGPPQKTSGSTFGSPAAEHAEISKSASVDESVSGTGRASDELAAGFPEDHAQLSVGAAPPSFLPLAQWTSSPPSEMSLYPTSSDEVPTDTDGTVAVEVESRDGDDAQDALATESLHAAFGRDRAAREQSEDASVNVERAQASLSAASIAQSVTSVASSPCHASGTNCPPDTYVPTASTTSPSNKSADSTTAKTDPWSRAENGSYDRGDVSPEAEAGSEAALSSGQPQVATTGEAMSVTRDAGATHRNEGVVSVQSRASLTTPAPTVRAPAGIFESPAPAMTAQSSRSDSAPIVPRLDASERTVAVPNEEKDRGVGLHFPSAPSKRPLVITLHQEEPLPAATRLPAHMIPKVSTPVARVLREMSVRDLGVTATRAPERADRRTADTPAIPVAVRQTGENASNVSGRSIVTAFYSILILVVAAMAWVGHFCV